MFVFDNSYDTAIDTTNTEILDNMFRHRVGKNVATPSRLTSHFNIIFSCLNLNPTCYSLSHKNQFNDIVLYRHHPPKTRPSKQ